MFPGKTIEPTHVTLGLVPEILYAIDVVDPAVSVFRNIQCIVTASCIRIHNIIGYDFVQHEIYQCVRPYIGDHLHACCGPNHKVPSTTMQYTRSRTAIQDSPWIYLFYGLI